MKKSVITVLLMFFIVGMTLCGCGKSEKTTEAATPVAEVEETTHEVAESDTEEIVKDAENLIDEQNEVQEVPVNIIDSITDEEIHRAVKEIMDYNQEFRDTGLIKEIKIDIDKVNKYEELSLLTDLEKVTASASVTFDIEWIKNCKQISDLKLEYNGLSDLAPLSELDNLKHLRISCEGLENINDLSNVKGLTDVYIESNSITDISAVESMNQLEYFVLEAPRSQVFAGRDWSNLGNIRVMAIDCNLFTDYNFISTIPVNPVYTLSLEEQSLRKDIKKEYQDYKANDYRSDYDFDKISDETCLVHYILKEESYDNNYLDSSTPLDYSDVVLNIYNAAYNDNLDRRSPMQIESAIAAIKNYEALGKLGFHIERYEEKWDSGNYYFILPGNTAVGSYVIRYLIEESNPIPEIKTSLEGAEQIDTHISNEWEDGQLWCDGVTYTLNGYLADMINDSYEYRINGKTVDIYKALDNYYVTNKRDVVQAYADGKLIACFDMSGVDVPLREATVNMLTLFRVKGHETNLPQEKENVHTMSLDFFTSDCATGFSVEGDAQVCRFQAKYIHVWIYDINKVEDECTYCNDGGYANTAESVTIANGTIMGKYWEE